MFWRNQDNNPQAHQEKKNWYLFFIISRKHRVTRDKIYVSGPPSEIFSSYSSMANLHTATYKP